MEAEADMAIVSGGDAPLGPQRSFLSIDAYRAVITDERDHH